MEPLDIIRIDFQPIIDLTTSRPHAFEALARPIDSTGKSIDTESFIKIAESMGNIDQVFKVVLDQVCCAIKSRQDLQKQEFLFSINYRS